MIEKQIKLLNDKTSFQYKDDYIFNDSFRIMSIEDGKEVTKIFSNFILIIVCKSLNQF